MGNAVSEPNPTVEDGEQQEAGAYPSALVVVGPSGVGKGTLINKLMEGNDKFGFSCSHTTRQPRPGEENGVHYHYTTKEDFEKGIADGLFLEYAYVHNNIYGTSIKAVEDVAASGRCCVLDIDVQGARQVRNSGLRAIFVFIAPPSMEDLEQRLRGRGTEREEQITTRLNNAREEMTSIDEPGLYDYILVNDNVDRCVEELRGVATRALAGQVGREEGLEPFSATASLRGWLRESTIATTISPPDTSRTLKGEAELLDRGWGVIPPLALDRWRSKVAIVTGAGQGVGWSLSLLLAAAGVRVVATSGGKEELERLQAAAVEEGGVSPADFLPVVCDLTKEGEVLALPRIIAKRWPGSGVDILVNNATVYRGESALMNGSTGAWVEMASINVLGAAMITREAVQDMERRKTWGHIVNITASEDGSSSSSSSSGATSGGGFYVVSKHALHAMADELRKEARAKGVGLRVSSVSIPSVPAVLPFEASNTSVLSPPGSSSAAAALQQQQQQKVGAGLSSSLTAEDVAHAVLWCLSAPRHVDVKEIVLQTQNQ